ncbi:Mce-associated membrane protein [Nocardioides terrae]|uniref:Mce-associated membrane protein n=1 Tax=Nocardioides terrae TaxID=574651 RepID=A0A1I1KIG8_9ACTN|nr:DnaJ domain-containing protein [Nocardioides terrae]SFC60569.1 Mce-associated membrane protein [Nocardioides terrae]
MSTSPTWYDLLDVDPTASTDEIRAAWKTAVADLDPTDRRFRRFSEAAAVLLDEQRRADYDASLPSAAVADTRPLPEELSPGAAASSVGDLPETEPGISDIEPAPVSVEHDPAIAGRTGRSRLADLRPVPLWLIAVAAALAVVLVAAAAFSWTRPDPKAIESNADSARSAAERAVVPVLSYDYRSLDEGQKEAESWLTPRYRDKDYRPLFATIKQNAPGTQTVVATKVVESAIVRAGEDRVEVMVLLDRPTTNKQQTSPVTYEDHVRVTMQRSGDDWLVDDMTT